MKIDEYEPRQIAALIGQSSPGTVATALNQNGFADYVWNMADGTLEQFERKQVGELLGKFEETEEQLGKNIANMQAMSPDGRMGLLVEGIAEPTIKGINTFEATPNGRYFRAKRSYNIPYNRYVQFLVALERQGVLVWQTPSWVGTANALVFLEKSAKQFTHTTLQRHLKIVAFHPDPNVKTLMGIAGAGLGPVLAEALLDVFDTPWEIMRTSPEFIAENVPGISLAKAKTIQRKFGKVVDE